MSNLAAYGPGKGAVGFERLGAWRMVPGDPMGKGAPLLFTQGAYTWKSRYGVLYKITGSSGGMTGNSYSGTTGGFGGAGFQIWWVGDGNSQVVTVGGASNPTSFGSIATALAGSTGGSASGSPSGIYVGGAPGLTLYGGGCNPYFGGVGGAGPFGLGSGGIVNLGNGNGQSGSGYGAGGGGGTTAASGQPGVLIIEIVPPFMNSQDVMWEPA